MLQLGSLCKAYWSVLSKIVLSSQLLLRYSDFQTGRRSLRGRAPLLVEVQTSFTFNSLAWFLSKISCVNRAFLIYDGGKSVINLIKIIRYLVSLLLKPEFGITNISNRWESLKTIFT